MKKARQNRAWLLAIARAVATQLKPHRKGTPLRIRTPNRAVPTNTDGWKAIVGNLGSGQPRLEIWLDRFAGYPDRKLYACFQSQTRPQMLAITKRVSRRLWPTRIVTLSDTDEEKFLVLKKRLRRVEFSAPLLEKYPRGKTFFGIYDPTPETSGTDQQFRNRAVAFFEDVVLALIPTTREDETRDVYPQNENRKRVVSHLQRERSRLLATERKIFDGYQCQACGMRFEDVYGKQLGQGYAEAHHVIPLSQLNGRVKTCIEDLRTVCANCHRMLHRMKGERGDIAKLRRMLKTPRKRLARII